MFANGYAENSIKILLIAGMCVVLVCGVQAAPVPITGPTTITAPGYYVLNNDVLNSPDPVYVLVRSSDVTIDGNGHTLSGLKRANSTGISFAPQTDSLSNVVVKNIVMQDWNTAVEFTRCNGGTMENLKASRNALMAVHIQGSSGVTLINCELNENNLGTYVEYSNHIFLLNNRFNNNLLYGAAIYQVQALTLDSNTANNNVGYGIYSQRMEQSTVSKNHAAHNDYGITLYGGDFNNTIKDNVVTDNNYGLSVFSGEGNQVTGNEITNNSRGIYLIPPVKGNWIFNNFLSNPDNVNPPLAPDTNTWNTQKTPGTAISGGSYRGGNLWETPQGTGFSQTCADSNGDGICDAPYTIAPNNVDQYPLKSRGAVSSVFAVTGITPSTAQNSGPVGIIDLSGSGFPQTVSVKLTRPGSLAITASGITVVSQSKITCNFDLTGKDAGTWDVVVTKPDGQAATLPNGFTIAAQSGAILIVSSYPAGADLFIDGVQRGTTPVTFNNILPGAHSVTITKPGYYGYYSDFSVTAGQPSTVDVTLQPLPSGNGIISVRSNPAGASIVLDGAATGKTTPYDFPEIVPGYHTLALSMPEYTTYTKTVTVDSGATVTVTAQLTYQPKDGVVFISSVPTGATIYIDDQQKGVTDTSLHLKAGTYVLKLTKEKYQDNISVFSIGAGDAIRLNKTLQTPGFECVLAVISLMTVCYLIRKKQN